MSSWDSAAFDRWLTTDPENQPCAHESVSWHGSRGECQDCGAAVAPEPIDPSEDDMFFPKGYSV